MKYDLSIVIAHFKPKELINNPLIKTISEINNQKNQFNIEIIIADDGSLYDYSFEKNHSIKNNLRFAIPGRNFSVSTYGIAVWVIQNARFALILVLRKINFFIISKLNNFFKWNKNFRYKILHILLFSIKNNIFFSCFFFSRNNS